MNYILTIKIKNFKRITNYLFASLFIFENSCATLKPMVVIKNDALSERDYKQSFVFWRIKITDRIIKIERKNPYFDVLSQEKLNSRKKLIILK